MYLAYLTSYAYVAVVWLNHKHTFVRIRAMDRGLHWANLGILFSTALLPFPTTIISDALRKGSAADERTAGALYASIGALLCMSWLVFFRYLSRHPPLLHKSVDPAFFGQETVRASAGIIGYLVAGLMATWSPPGSRWSSSLPCRSATPSPATGFTSSPPWCPGSRRAGVSRH
jgi:TMEM175 potassium channel family protein